MAWFKVDDGFYDHPKVEELPNAAIGLWIKAGTWCAKHETDGLISAARVRALKGSASQVRSLISARLWVETVTDSGAKAYRFWDWIDYQPTREQREEDRAVWREKRRKQRDEKRHKQAKCENVPQSVSESESRSVSEMSGTRPDPTRPDPTITTDVVITPQTPQGGLESSTANAVSLLSEHGSDETEPATKPTRKRNTYPPAFEAWWRAYPRKANASKKRAHDKWTTATRDHITPDELQTLTDTYAATHGATDEKYLPHPDVWLNQHRWETVHEPRPAIETHDTHPISRLKAAYLDNPERPTW